MGVGVGVAVCDAGDPEGELLTDAVALELAVTDAVALDVGVVEGTLMSGVLHRSCEQHAGLR